MKIDTSYIPSDKLKSVQKVELDILKEFIRICKKYNLTYYAEGGTLLGAARHNGFIPWDDDIDVSMMWSDYKKFQEVAPFELRKPYFFQDYSTELFFDISPMARIRNSNTTGCTSWEYENVSDPSYNYGIFIDIWVLAPIPNEERQKAELKESIDCLWRAIRGWYAKQNILKGNGTNYEKYIPDWEAVSDVYSIIDLKKLYIEKCYRINEETKEVGMTSFRTLDPKFIWEKEWFDETIELPFEDIAIVCPKMFDEVLTKTFNNWQIPVYNGSIHDMVICDVNTPYHKNKVLQDSFINKTE